MTLAAGSTLGPYRIIEPIGRGGMASVFKAYEASLDRYVALKVLPPEFLHDPTFAERFRREAQTIARLEHPQIIPIFAYDIDASTGTPWMAMRLISGGSLSQRIKRGRLMPSESARILKDVADALDYAHGAGVIHRDVKPQNVLLDDAGRVYLADFGIAKMIESSAHMTQTGMITGTPQYMAPEQALGKSIDKSIDIYALGIVAYELFTGRVPFSADTPVAVLMKQASEPMPLPPVSEVQEDVTRAILRATAKDPQTRWPSASSFAQAVVNATTSVGAVAATTALPVLVEDTVRGMAPPPPPPPPPARLAAPPGPATPKNPTPRAPSANQAAGSGVALAASVVVGLALMAAIVVFFGYRYYRANQTIVAQNAGAPATVTTPTAGPVGSAVVPPVEATPKTATATAEPSPETKSPSTEPAAVTAQPPLSPAERRAILARRPLTPRERVQAMAEARRQVGATGPTGGRAPEERGDSMAPAPRPARTRINLEVEATQPSTGAQISALYAEVLIDNRPARNFVIRFSGANSFARWKKVETIVLEDIPLSAREITVAVATDPGLNEERMEGSTRLSLEAQETNLSVAVRFYNQFDKSVRFR